MSFTVYMKEGSSTYIHINDFEGPYLTMEKSENFSYLYFVKICHCVELLVNGLYVSKAIEACNLDAHVEDPLLQI